MNKKQESIVKQALANGGYQLYYATDFLPDDENDWDGWAPGENGGEIHLIAQNDTAEIYGETTDDLAGASYLIGSAGILDEAGEQLERKLNEEFGRAWPDNYAQTHGWFLP